MSSRPVTCGFRVAGKLSFLSLAFPSKVPVGLQGRRGLRRLRDPCRVLASSAENSGVPGVA